MIDGRYQILLTNDDGIQSPGIWTAAQALSKLGFVTLAAPRDQASSTGRSMPLSSDGKIVQTNMQIGDQDWVVYAVGGTPAQVVVHSVLEIMPATPDLVVSGINYGENLGNSVMTSGTVGAALEAASLGIPAIAASVELQDIREFNVYSENVRFDTAAYFTAYFAQAMLEKRMPHDVDVLKIEVPHDATLQTPWRVTRQGRDRYYKPMLERTGSWDENGRVYGLVGPNYDLIEPDSDIHAMLVDRVVSVTPLSLDLTSRVDFGELEQLLNKAG
ncbi:MAG: 5'/3'-nucleotidase SurE [Anaerolineaceae bacterium]|nr:5'/3'-nucleotidase SurE [Anaerolineaceae bacterium]